MNGILKSLSIPSDWHLIPIGKLLLDSQYGTNAPTVEDGDVSIVGMKDIQDGKIITDDLTRTYLPEREKPKFLLKKGDLLINRTNSYDLVGKVGIYDSDEEAIFASYLVRLNVDNEQAVPEYLYYWLNSHKAQIAIKRIATKAISQANINPTEFKKHCLVPLPSLLEQTAIADLLSTWDAAIDKTEKLIAAKEKRLNALYQLFFQPGMPANSSWRFAKIGQFMTPRRERAVPSEEIPLFSLTIEDVVTPKTDRYNRDFLVKDNGSKTYKVVYPGDHCCPVN